MALIRDYYPGGLQSGPALPVLKDQFDTVTQTFTTWGTNGVQTGQRAMTAAEITQFAAAAAIGNHDTLTSRAQAALAANATFQALAAPTNAQVVAQVQLLTKECNALIRLLIGQLDAIAGT